MALRFTLSMATLLLLTGCEGFRAGRSLSLWKPQQPAPTKSIGDNEEAQTDRDYLRLQGRGGRMLERENDPLKKFIHSDTALEIERNLGIGE